MSDDTSRNSDEFGQTDGEQHLPGPMGQEQEFTADHSIPGSIGDVSSYHQAPIIDGLQGLLDSITPGVPATIIFIDDDGPADPVAIITALKLLGISPSEAMDFADLFMQLIMSQNAANAAYGYGPYYTATEFNPHDIRRTAHTIGTEDPYRVQRDHHEQRTQAGFGRVRKGLRLVSNDASPESAPSYGVPFGFGKTRRFVTSTAQRSALLMALTAIGQLTPDVDAEIDPETLARTNAMSRFYPHLNNVVSLGQLTPAVDADFDLDPEAAQAANVVRAFITGSQRARREFEPYIETTGPDDTPDASA